MREIKRYLGVLEVGAALARIERSARWVWLLALLMALALAHTAQAAKDDVSIDVVINGVRLEGRGLVEGDRTYVSLEEVAAVLGGSVVPDPELNLVFVNTGRYQHLTLDGLKALNPKARTYRPLSPLVPATGIRHGAAGPHLAVTATPAGIVTGVMLAVPAADGAHYPWYEQPKESPAELQEIGQVYTQQVFVVDRTLVRPSLATEIVFNGERLWVPEGALLWRGEELFVRLRDLAEASGGGVGWDPKARVASAKIVPGRELTPEKLAELNPKLAWHYEVRGSLLPGGGLEYRALGPGLAMGIDETGAVTRFGAAFAEDLGWFPWFDQERGAPLTLLGLGRTYTQQLRLE